MGWKRAGSLDFPEWGALPRSGAMEVKKLCCQGCGADLEVADDIRFLNCNYCGARLEIIREATTTHSRVLDKIEKRTGEMADDLKVIRLQNDLERLDREWEQERARYLVRNQDGGVSEPSPVAAVIGGVVMIGFAIFWMSFTSSMHAPAIFPLFGIVFIGAALFMIMTSLTKAQGMRNGEANYQTRRSRLLAEMERVRKG